MKKNSLKRSFVILILLIAVISGATYYIQPSELPVSLPAHFLQQTLVIDAGHGGEDGGAVSISGAAESHINLAIALSLDEILGLYGVNCLLLRDSDVSLHDSSANTLREKKVSDLKNRVRIIEASDNPILISIHQNTYSSSRYHGAQVFYTNNHLSSTLAQITQDNLAQHLDPSNTRKPAVISDQVYLMNHISCPAILVECGFLSNPQEDLMLQDSTYQLKIAAALAGSYLNFQQKLSKGEIPDVDEK